MSMVFEPAVSGWGHEGHAFDELVEQLSHHVRTHVWFALSCQSTGVAPVFYAGGPLDGMWEDLPLAEGSKPPMRHRVVRDMSREQLVFVMETDASIWDDRRPPRIHDYERSMHPVHATPSRPMAWRYLHVNAY
jgi:hypothetical protein